MELDTKKGYKQSEVGLIPEDWSVVKLGDLTAKIIGGGTPSRANSKFWNGDIPWVTVKDFTTFDKYRSQESITKEGLKNSSANLIPKGNLITSTRMALGKALIYEVDVSINQDLKALFFDSRTNTKFAFYWFEFNAKKIEELGSGSTVMGISLTDLKGLLVALPPLAEQRAIATALGDVDSLLGSLAQRIAKKKALKQGAMQALLTPPQHGGKRLPGFSGEWVEKTLGDILEGYQLGGNYENNEIESEFPLIKMGNLGRGSISLSKVEYIPSYVNPSKKDILKYGDVLFNTRNTLDLVGKISIWKDELPRAYFNSNIMRLVFHKDFVGSNFFMNYILNTAKIIAELKGFATGTTSVAAIYTRDLLKLKVCIPKPLEQRAIAEILSTMDAEIVQLEAKKAKYEALKQGMMQELLTGKTRLLE